MKTATTYRMGSFVVKMLRRVSVSCVSTRHAYSSTVSFPIHFPPFKFFKLKLPSRSRVSKSETRGKQEEENRNEMWKGTDRFGFRLLCMLPIIIFPTSSFDQTVHLLPFFPFLAGRETNDRTTIFSPVLPGSRRKNNRCGEEKQQTGSTQCWEKYAAARFLLCCIFLRFCAINCESTAIDSARAFYCELEHLFSALLAAFARLRCLIIFQSQCNSYMLFRTVVNDGYFSLPRARESFWKYGF